MAPCCPARARFPVARHALYCASVTPKQRRPLPASREDHMANSPLIAGLELGGTKCVAILGTGPDDVRARDTVPTTDPATTLAALEQVLDGWQFDALGIASFGPLDLDPHSSGESRSGEECGRTCSSRWV